MAGLSKEELDERCIKRFGEKDQTLIPVYAIGAEFGYFGRVDDREISNASGMYGDPLFIHKMMEKGMAPVSMKSEPSIGLDQGNFTDPMQYFSEGEEGKHRVSFKGLIMLI